MIIVINGAPTTGKDTFVQYCQNLMPKGYVMGYSTVDFVKAIALECGWDGIKTPKNRKFLSDLKDLLTEWDDVPFKRTIMAANSHINALNDTAKQYSVTFIHCREPKEIQKIVDRTAAVSVLIRRPTVENNDQSNHADANVLNYNYDYVINNDGDLDSLQEKARQFLEEVGVYPAP